MVGREGWKTVERVEKPERTREGEEETQPHTHIQTEAETAKPRLEAAITAGEARWELRRLATDAAWNRKPDSGYSVAWSLLRFEYGNGLTAPHPPFQTLIWGVGVRV